MALPTFLLFLGMGLCAAYWWLITKALVYVGLFGGVLLYAVLMLMYGFRDKEADPPIAPPLPGERWISHGAFIGSGVTLFNLGVYALQRVTSIANNQEVLSRHLSVLMDKSLGLGLGFLGAGIYLGHYLEQFPGRGQMLILCAVGVLWFYWLMPTLFP